MEIFLKGICTRAAAICGAIFFGLFIHAQNLCASGQNLLSGAVSNVVEIPKLSADKNATSSAVKVDKKDSSFGRRAKLFAANLLRRANADFKDAAQTQIVWAAVSASGAENIGAWGAEDESSALSRPLALGKAGVPMLSMLALNLQSCGKLRLGQKAAQLDGIFRTPKNSSSSPTLGELLENRAGIPRRLDELLPADAAPEEIFDLIMQTPLYLSSSDLGGRSDAGLSAAAYLCGVAAYRSLRGNPTAAFKMAAENFLFLPMQFENAKFLDELGLPQSEFPADFKPALLPSCGFALSARDAAKWLKTELGVNGFSSVDAEEISSRRLSQGGGKKSAENAGFSSSEMAGLICHSAASSRFGSSCAVAILPKANVALFVWINSDSRKAREFVAETVRDFSEMAASLDSFGSRRR